MKKSLLLLSLLIIVPLASAAQINMNSSFGQGGTLIAQVVGDFIHPLQQQNILLYNGHVRVSFIPYINSINNTYYIYGQLSGHAPGDYSLVLTGLTYYESGQVSTSDISKNFTITSKSAGFYITPGFIQTSNNFSIGAGNIGGQSITVSSFLAGAAPDANSNLFGQDYSGEASNTSIQSGSGQQVGFAVNNNTNPFSIAVLKSGSTEYYVPVLFNKEQYLAEIASQEPASPPPQEQTGSSGSGTTASPIVLIFGQGTPAVDANISRNYIYVNLSVSGPNLSNITYYLYNASTLVNKAVYTYPREYINWTGLKDSEYTYYAVAYNTSGSRSQTPVRSVLTDTTPPKSIAYAETSPGNDSYKFGSETNGSVIVHLFAVDGSGIGVNPTYPVYCIDLTDNCTPAETMNSSGVLVSANGTSYIRFFSEDLLGNTEQIQSKQIDINRTEGNITGNKTGIENVTPANFSVQPTLLQIDLATDSNTTRYIYISNKGNQSVNITMTVPEDLKDYIFLPENISIDANTTTKVEMNISSGPNSTLAKDVVNISSGNVSHYSYVLLNFSQGYVPANNSSQGNSSQVFQTCAEIGGQICGSGTCSAQSQRTVEGICCLGTCTAQKTSSAGKSIGWTLAVIAIIAAVAFFSIRYRKAKGPKVNLLHPGK